MTELMYKPFHETYYIVGFMMSVGLMYPNPARDKLRRIVITMVIISGTPFICIILLDMYNCWIEGDIVYMIRQSIILGPFLGVMFKMLVMFYKRVQAKELIDEFNRDYASYNNFNEEYRAVINTGIRNSRIYTERGWFLVILTGVLIFPIKASVLNIYSYLFKFESTKYMVHDLNKPFSDPEERFESPYYEIMFFYTVYCFMWDIINFTGYDGFFSLCVNHACMKIEMIWKSLDVALKSDDRHMRLIEVIKEHNRLLRFVSLIQDTFNLWLGIIYIATVIQICSNMYNIAEGYGFDLKYSMFVIVAILHIYLPCHYAAKLKSMSAQTATVIYSSGWENVNDLKIRKMLVFMIARAQVALKITAFKIIIFDMELFKSIMQASYSMYTLLRSS